jgi:flavin-dependent dehydrogenase
MNAALRAHVAVIGGGPAGAVTALLLARAGVDVLLYERSQYATLRLGETLPPSVNPFLRQLGLWDRFQALGSIPSYQTASAWGDNAPRERSFLFSPHGCGWHVDRARFDAMLADAAESAGARVIRAQRVSEVQRAGLGFTVRAAADASVDCIVDATGRVARFAKKLGAERKQFDRLVCAARVFANPGQPVGDTFIEAEANGWWYAAPLPNSRRLVAIFADAGQAVRAHLSTAAGWNTALAATTHVREWVDGAAQTPVHMVSCASHELRPVSGEGWIAVGDAALAVDPLSSGGVAFALRSAIAASEMLLGGARTTYAELVASAAAEYRQVRAQIYGWEDRFAEREFWRSRAGGTTGSGAHI